MLLFESHSTSTDNEKNIASGWLDPSLSSKGIRQAEELGLRYEKENFCAIYVSDLKRSFETAKFAFGHRKIPINIDARLREWNYGKYNGASAVVVDNMKINYLKIPFPQGESLTQVISRFDLFEKENLKNKQEKILIIGHRATYYALEFTFRKISLKNLVTTPWKWQPGWNYNV